MTKLNSNKISNKLYLTKLSIDSKVIPTRSPTNHVFCCDVSGSMWNSLPKMRTHLKNNIPDVVSNDDTVTIIAFSGKNECVVIKSLVKINDINALKKLNDAIDRYLTPQGMTCFYDPVETTVELINQNSGTYNFIFLSDGGNNDCPWDDVVSVLNDLSNKVGGSTIIEYGYYADTEKLSEMAEILGGAHIAASDFDKYVPVIEKSLKGSSENKKEVDISSVKSEMKYAQVIYLKNGQINVVSTANKTSILIPESVDSIYFLTTSNLGSESEVTDALYAMTYVCAGAFRYEIVENLLKTLGDTKFIDLYQNAFGKQKLFDFREELLTATFNSPSRGKITSGYKPKINSYCVLDFLGDLAEDKANQLRINVLLKDYTRIGAKSVTKVELTEDQKDRLSEAKTKKDVDKINSELDNSIAKIRKIVTESYPLCEFTWNEDRANLSALMKLEVELDLPKNKFNLEYIDSFIFRNYTIIKDGILNISKFPLILSTKTYNKLLKKKDLIIDHIAQVGNTIVCDIDVSNLPIVNRKLVKSIKCSEVTELARDILEHKFYLKYIKSLKTDISDTSRYNSNDPFYYGEEVIEWLKSLGITERGFSPKTETIKSGDSYMALTFKSDFKGFSSIPKISDIEKKLANNKSLTPSETLMKNIMDKVNDDISNDGRSRSIAINHIIKEMTDQKNYLVEQLSQRKFGLILSRKWFSDRKGFDDNHDEIEDSFGNKMEIDYKFTETKQYL